MRSKAWLAASVWLRRVRLAALTSPARHACGCARPSRARFSSLQVSKSLSDGGEALWYTVVPFLRVPLTVLLLRAGLLMIDVCAEEEEGSAAVVLEAGDPREHLNIVFIGHVGA